MSADEYEVRITARVKFPASAREAEILALKIDGAMTKLEKHAERKWGMDVQVKVGIPKKV